MIRTSARFNQAAIQDALRQELLLLSRRVREQVLRELIAATPVDTGEAASSWVSRVETEERFLLENDEDYIKFLNAGSSRQAGARFIERIVLRYGSPAGTVVQYR